LKMNNTQSLTTIVGSNHIDLAIAGWLDAHSWSPKTQQAYADTINQYRGELRRIGHDLDSDIGVTTFFPPRIPAKAPERSGRGLRSNVALVLEDRGSGVLTYFCSTSGPEVASRQGSKTFEQAANQA